MALTIPPSRTTLAVRPAPSIPVEALMSTSPAVDVVIPVHDEQVDLERSVLRLYEDGGIELAGLPPGQ